MLFETNPGDYADDEEAADECLAYTSAHAGVARDCLETILERCGWRGENTRWERDDIPCMSTIYLTWWDPEPQERVERLRTELAAILPKATPR